MLPLYVCAVRLAVFTETVKLAGMLPLPGDTLSQEFPEVTAALTATELAGDEPIINCWLEGPEASPSV
jgi:hypothetical protein